MPAIAFSVPGGELWIVEGVRSGREGADEIAMLHKFYAMNTLKRAPETVRSFALAPGKYDFSEFGRDVDLSAAIRAIKNDVGKIRTRRFFQKLITLLSFENEKYSPTPDKNRNISTPTLPVPRKNLNASIKN